MHPHDSTSRPTHTTASPADTAAPNARTADAVPARRARSTRPASHLTPWRVRLRRRLRGRHALRARTTPTSESVSTAPTAATTTATTTATTATTSPTGHSATPKHSALNPDAHCVDTPAPAPAAAWVRAGWNTGGVPYGYRARHVLVTPTHGRPRWRSHLVIEPVEAATVALIFTWRAVDHLSTTEIAQRLNAARYPQPLDPITGQPRPWTPRRVRTVIGNPKYLGQQVWGRTRHGRPAPARDWTWSAPNPHLAVVAPETFAAAQITQSGTADSGMTNPTIGPVRCDSAQTCGGTRSQPEDAESSSVRPRSSASSPHHQSTR